MSWQTFGKKKKKPADNWYTRLDGRRRLYAFLGIVLIIVMIMAFTGHETKLELERLDGTIGQQNTTLDHIEKAFPELKGNAK